MATTLTGLIAAVHTPMKADCTLNLDTIESQARWMTANRISGVFVCGSTGEGLSLTMAERLRIAERWRDVAEDLAVIVHVGHNCVPEAVEIARHAEQVVGAHAIAAVSPTFFRPSCVDELVSYCAEIAEAAPNTPFYYYHIPIRTTLALPAIDIMKAAAERIPTFAGLKFTHEDLMDFRQCLTYEGGKYDMLYGRDEMLLSALALGARGAIGSTYNFAAPLYHRIIDAYERGDMLTAQREQTGAMEMVGVLRRYGGIVAIKPAMKAIGLDCGPSRLPLRRMSDDEYRAFCRDLDRIGFFEYCSQPPA